MIVDDGIKAMPSPGEESGATPVLSGHFPFGFSNRGRIRLQFSKDKPLNILANTMSAHFHLKARNSLK